jgi:hypothetical protein
LDLTAEAVYINRSTREAIYAAGVVDQRYDTTTGPYGALKGLSYYLQLAIWAAGTPRINGEPGTYPLPKLRTSTAGSSGDALEVVVRWEQLLLDYNSNSRNAATAAKGFLDGGIDGNSGTTSLKLDDLQVGVTYWATKHVRFTAQVSYYIVPGTLNGSYDRFGVSHSPTGNPTNQAQSPGALGGTTSVVNSGGNTTTTVTGFNFNANTWEEFSVRAAIAL